MKWITLYFRATEEGVNKVIPDEKPNTNKKTKDSVVASTSTKEDSKINTTTSFSDSTSVTTSENKDQSEHNEVKEVSAMDILYPKEKYKYYLNKDLCKDTAADGRNVLVKRGGKLVRLSSVLNKSNKEVGEPKEPKETVELVYVYDNGRLLTLAGSLTKINPSNSSAVRARVVLPNGITPPGKSKVKEKQVEKKAIEAVEINEDMAKFALSALFSPKESESSTDSSTSLVVPVKEKPKPASKKKPVEEAKPIKPTKSNILDIISAKLDIPTMEMDSKQSNCNNGTLSKEESFSTWTKKMEEKLKKGGKLDNGSNADDYSTESNDDNIITDMGPPPPPPPLKQDKPKIFKKNIYRFPSLSREMKRLNMNFVNFDKAKVRKCTH